MRPRSNWNRRTFLGSVAALAGSLAAPKKLFASARSASRAVSGFGQSGNPYEELGVTTVINCEGTMTMLGGSLPHPELEAVMMQAGRHFVSIPELEVAAGNKIAEMLKLPEGYTALVTSGAAAAMQSGLAGILTGSSETYIKQLPDLTGLKSEVIIQKSHRNPFDHQLRSTGVKLIEIETRDDLQKAVNDRTAMMHFTNFANEAGQIKVDEWPKLAKQYNLPCMNDAAADTPPVSHLWDYANMGYDLITFRVGKEEIIGMIKALELFLSEDHDALAKEWQDRLERISQQITKVPGVSTSFFTPEIANHVPHMQITWDPGHINLTPTDASKILRSSKPSIVIGGGEGKPGLAMNSFMLQPGEEKIVAEQLVKLFKAHSA